jgi:hypothetical protein
MLDGEAVVISLQARRYNGHGASSAIGSHYKRWSQACA